MTTTSGQHHPEAAPATPPPAAAGATGSQPHRRAGRRAVLKWAGIGSGAVIVTGGAGLLWRAGEQGVFDTGEGPAYRAWQDWRVVPGDPPAALTRAAVLAASAHNTQPWRFVAAPDRIDLYADTARTIGTMDPLRREMEISLGCALENMVIAARAAGFAPAVTLLPTAADATHVARVTLSAGSVDASALYEAIPNRHTNRAAYDIARPVAPATLDEVSALNDLDDVQLIWLTEAETRARFGDLTVAATEAIIADAEQAADDAAWFRQDWDNIQRSKDGITVDAAGLDDATRAIAKILPHQSRGAMNDAWLKRTRDTHVKTAAAFGLLAVRDGGDTAQRVRSGRLYERLALFSTARGLAVQPLAQTAERADRERSSGLEPIFTRALAALLSDPSWQVVLPFRIGYATRSGRPSPRRPAADVLR